MKKIMMTKYGFVRTPAEDFSDDGNRFHAFKVGQRVRVTKCVSDGEAYIDGAITTGKLPYEIYSKLPHYPHLGRLNGVSVAALTDEDLQELYEDCLSYEAEYTAAEAYTKYPTKDELTLKCNRIQAKLLLEMSELETIMSKHAVEAATKFSKWEWQYLQDYLKNMVQELSRYNPEKFIPAILGTARSFTFLSNKEDVEPTYYYRYIKEMFQKHSII
jgi:hypothetical protein